MVMIMKDKKIWDVIVVGAGASGLMAAIHAARAGVRVLILEHMDRPAKKLCMTGNGKCNFTNNEQGVSHYHCADPAFVMSVLNHYSKDDTIQFFRELGVRPVMVKGGYYPASGQAITMREVLLQELHRLNVKILYEIGIRSIKKEQDSFVFYTKSDTYRAKKCIFATGGKSFKKTGSDGSGFLYLDEFSHHVRNLVPALAGLQSNLAFFKKVAGIRAGVCVKSYTDNVLVREERGELQLTDYGLSGICIFQLSGQLSRALIAHKKAEVAVDFAPEFADAKELRHQLHTLLHSKFMKQKTVLQALSGYFHEKLIAALLAEAGIDPALPVTKLEDEALKGLCVRIKDFRVPITGINSFDQAQVTAGGVDIAEIDPATMESKLVSGLYFAGEMIDVDGDCGGYNLQFAWSTGAIAGKSAAQKERSGCYESDK